MISMVASYWGIYIYIYRINIKQLYRPLLCCMLNCRFAYMNLDRPVNETEKDQNTPVRLDHNIDSTSTMASHVTVGLPIYEHSKDNQINEYETKKAARKEQWKILSI